MEQEKKTKMLKPMNLGKGKSPMPSKTDLRLTQTVAGAG